MDETEVDRALLFLGTWGVDYNVKMAIAIISENLLRQRAALACAHSAIQHTLFARRFPAAIRPPSERSLTRVAEMIRHATGQSDE